MVNDVKHDVFLIPFKFKLFIEHIGCMMGFCCDEEIVKMPLGEIWYDGDDRDPCGDSL